jgi:DNA polymerase III psi subunit
MLNHSAYLYAMGITQWRSSAKIQPTYYMALLEKDGSMVGAVIAKESSEHFTLLEKIVSAITPHFTVHTVTAQKAKAMTQNNLSFLIKLGANIDIPCNTLIESASLSQLDASLKKQLWSQLKPLKMQYFT